MTKRLRAEGNIGKKKLLRKGIKDGACGPSRRGSAYRGQDASGRFLQDGTLPNAVADLYKPRQRPLGAVPL